MNADEALALCRYVKACCPQQAIDEWTPLAWADHLADYPYADAKEATKQITAKQPFVTIAEVLTVIKQIRAKRIHEAGDLTPPPNLTPVETVQWLKGARRRVADGEAVDDLAAYGVLKERHLPDIRSLLPRPDATEPTDPICRARMAPTEEPTPGSHFRHSILHVSNEKHANPYADDQGDDQ